MTYDDQLKAAHLEKEQTVDEADLPPQNKKPKIDAFAATPAGHAFTHQQSTLVPPQSGSTILFQNCVFHGCSVMPPQGQLQNIIPQQAESTCKPGAEEFNMTMKEVNELFSDF